MHIFDVFCVEKLQLTICKNWRVRIWPVTWGLTSGFDRLKTTPDRSSLGAGCTTTLSYYFPMKYMGTRQFVKILNSIRVTVACRCSTACFATLELPSCLACSSTLMSSLLQFSPMYSAWHHFFGQLT